MVDWDSQDLSGDAGKDPYELWYFGAGNAPNPPGGGFDTELWYPRLVRVGILPSGGELDEDSKLALLEALTTVYQDLPRTNDGLRITAHDFHYGLFQLFNSTSFEADFIVFARGDIAETTVRELFEIGEAGAGGISLKAKVLRTGAGIRSVSLPAPFLQPEVIGLPPREKARFSEGAPVWGVSVDHAIGFANKVFRKPAGAGESSRFRSIWLQEQTAGVPSGPMQGIGKQITRSQIDAEITAKTEQQIYRTFQPPDLSRAWAGLQRGTSHGTATAAVAFGKDASNPKTGFDTVELLGVQLPAGSVAQTNGLLHDLYVLSALNYAWFEGVKYLQEGVGNLYPRLFVNHSFGDFSGRADGLDLLNTEFDRRIEAGEIEMLSGSAGNSFHSATHARYDAHDLSGSGQDLTLVVQPDNRDVTFVQIWTDFGRGNHSDSIFPLSVRFTAPGDQLPNGGQETFQVGYQYSATQGGQLLLRAYCRLNKSVKNRGRVANRRVLTIAIPPTADDNGVPTGVPVGRWRLRLARYQASYNKRVGLWVERGDTPDGFRPRGRQSYFEHPDYQRFDGKGRLPKQDNTSPIKRFGTLSGAGRSAKAHIVGSHRQSDLDPSDFSSASSVLYPMRGSPGKRLPRQPRFTAASELSPARPNVLVPGTFSGSTRRVRGTSFSAPLALRSAILAIVDGAAGGLKPIVVPSADPEKSGAGPLPIRPPFDSGR